MQNMINYIFKGICLCVFFTRCFVATNIFKLLLVLNKVTYGKKLSSNGGAIPQLRISPKAKCVKFGKNVSFNNYNDVAWYSKCAIWVKKEASLIIGDDSGLNGALVYASNSVLIGNNVKIGGGTKIFDTDFHPLNYEIRRSSNEGTLTAPVVIEDDVFIGTSCLIMKGVHIGARSIVAAGSVVVKSIPSDEIWGGNPAKFIRKIS